MRFLAGLVALLGVTTSNAFANDTTAQVAAGGLIYVQNENVSMADEKLYISMEKVTVDYIFHNNSDKDVESLIAFPFPDVTGSGDFMDGVPDTESDNFLDFQATQDGKPITLNLQQRAFSLGLDVTDELVKAGVPLVPFGNKTGEALNKISPALAADWEKRGMIIGEEIDNGSGMQRDLVPVWTLKSAYYWKTIFPAGKDVAVSHKYKTGTGSTVAVTFLDDDPANTTQAEYKQKYCVDDDLIKSLRKAEDARRAAGGYAAFFENWVGYILTTGNNWSGPIGHFTLTIDKGDEANLVSFCGEGVKKTGPTTFQMTKEDFYPDKDLEILFLTAVKDQ
jgi:Domain of unknown function (DUF4424)